MSPDHLDRRSVLRLVGAALLVAGCGGAAGSDPTAVRSPSRRPTSRPPVSPPAPVPPAAPPVPAPPPYVPLPNEPVPNCKKLAADFVQAITTGDAQAGGQAAVARALPLTGAGFDADQSAAVAGPLFSESSSRGEIVYPQLGGLVPIGPGAVSASVMVVVRQTLVSPSGLGTDVVRVCDVRLAVQDGQWRVVALASVGGEPVDRPAGLEPRALRVLDDPRIDLPDTARWDVHAGRISLELLDVLATAAQRAPVSVAVLQSGHPREVFATQRLSNHTEGRAVDVWRIAGQPVVSSGAATGPARDVLLSAYGDRRVSQTGSPQGSDLDGSGRRSFVDLVHADHLHLAVRR